MKALFSLLVLLFVHFAVLVPAAQAQSSPAVASPAIGKLVVVRITDKSYRSYEARFETDGESIGGLTEDALSKRFSRVNSTAAILNFVVENGYRVLSFAPVDGEIYNGKSSGFGGFTALLERVK